MLLRALPQNPTIGTIYEANEGFASKRTFPWKKLGTLVHCFLSKFLMLISALITHVLRSHLGHILLAVSWSFIIFVLVPYPSGHPQFVDCTPIGDEIYTLTEVHRIYPIWIVVIGVTHFPSMLATILLTKALQGAFSLSCTPTAKVEYLLFSRLALFNGSWSAI